MQASLEAYLGPYNIQCPYQGGTIKGQTPQQVLLEGLATAPTPQPEEEPITA